MKTLVHYTDASEIISQRIKSLLTASELDHLSSKFYYAHLQKKWRNLRARNNDNFEPVKSQLILVRNK